MENAPDQSLKLKVTEGLGKDVGRSLARMDPIDMKALGVDIGDFVELSGKRKTVCKVMPAYKDDRGGNRVQVDGISRGNAEVALDDLVSVRKVLTQHAKQVVLSPATSDIKDRDLQYMAARLDGLTVVVGDMVRGIGQSQFFNQGPAERG